MSDSRAETLPKSKAGVYLRRAENLLQAMRWAEEARNADGVAVAAVQAAVALGDAFTVFTQQRRSRAQDHHELVKLVAQSRTKSSAEVAGLVERILDQKSEVEYGNRDVRLADAEVLAKAVRKLAVVVRDALA
jgi:uncharacterized protein HemX